MADDKITYLSEIMLALKHFGGMVALAEIHSYILKRDRLPYIHTNPNWMDNVSAEIQKHCRKTKSYKGAEDLFYSVYGLGQGCYGLNSMRVNGYYDANPIELRQIETINNESNLDITEKEMIIKSRIGQGVFRKNLLKKYKCCLITGIENPRLLIAGHIKPWHLSNNSERLSVDNGLILSPLYDKLFDSGFITFDDDMHMIISNRLSQNDRRKIQAGNMKINIPQVSDDLKSNMAYHREKVFN